MRLRNFDKLAQEVEEMVSISCSKCGEVEEDFCDADRFAYRLDQQGWTVTRQRNVLCPNCRPKRKNAPAL